MNDNEKKVKYSVIKAFMQPFWIISDNLKAFFVQSLCFSFAILILSYLMGQKYICFFNERMAVDMYCPNLSYLYLPYFFIKLLIISVFIKIWYDSVFKKEQINKEYFKNKNNAVFRIFLAIMVFMFLNFMPVISGLVLFFRVPNPVWQIELIFFTFVSVGFVVPFVLMRVYSYFTNFLENKNFYTLKQVWAATSGYCMKISWTSILFFLIDLTLLISSKNMFSRFSSMPAELYNIIAELVMAFINYVIVIIFINFIQVQKQMFLD